MGVRPDDLVVLHFPAQPTPVRDDAGKVRKPASIAQRTPQ
jgi:hypothetical protein